jgi:hypothetical protein
VIFTRYSEGDKWPGVIFSEVFVEFRLNYWPTVPAAGNFLTAQKVTKNASGTYGFRTSLDSSRFLRVFAIHGLLSGNLDVASDGDRCFSSAKKNVARLHP